VRSPIVPVEIMNTPAILKAKRFRRVEIVRRPR
jgi:hypothetical protein